ncbi:DegT/DnrJ/EryC1/StrS family aminotransferase [Segeticoccus rhizosphaerae]|uniref:DegT/DnrJ/EryC1/StrS family aminotransferase n=1 Tax=Segeticoccus rhizosphaerae TaxID=1104777 RepID=UPI0010BF8771|nr:DegT/DnrJ/EryC1/StrS aminotransferase family protein [Ornithinicoccus soli]
MTVPDVKDTNPVPFALPDITEREISEVVDTLRSNWVTTGPKVRRFEGGFATAVGGRHAVAVNSCTAALHLALEALGVTSGDRVYMPPYTFAATAEVVRYLGATPVFVDVERDTLNIDLDLLERQLEQDRAVFPGRGRAVMPVHIAGVPVDMDRLWDLARKFSLAVVEDAAHAFPASRAGNVVGSMPDDIRGAVCFSFYATKTITTGEGGMLVTPDESLAERARSMSLHGLSRAAWKRYESGGNWRYDIVAPGYKYNLTDIAAALGLVQLDRAVVMRDKRAAIAERYNKAFADTRLELPTVPSGVASAWHLYIVRARDEASRDSLIAHLTAEGVGSSVHFIPLHLHSYYRETYGYEEADFPVASSQFSRAVSLPAFSSMSDLQIRRVIDVVHAWEEPA